MFTHLKTEQVTPIQKKNHNCRFYDKVKAAKKEQIQINQMRDCKCKTEPSKIKLSHQIK